VPRGAPVGSTDETHPAALTLARCIAEVESTGPLVPALPGVLGDPLMRAAWDPRQNTLRGSSRAPTVSLVGRRTRRPRLAPSWSASFALSSLACWSLA
jgi:hypothetical protein